MSISALIGAFDSCVHYIFLMNFQSLDPAYYPGTPEYIEALAEINARRLSQSKEQIDDYEYKSFGHMMPKNFK
tara:strand:+ start:20 stop:238 length:219 start_codon:yes stop_codon:yes gene_type:complete